MISQRAIFEGNVQGVGFRYAVKDLAKGFDVIGWVKNLPDGSVELRINGEQEELAEFLKEIIEESSMAHHIKNTYISDMPPLEGAKGFVIAS